MYNNITSVVIVSIFLMGPPPSTNLSNNWDRELESIVITLELTEYPRFLLSYNGKYRIPFDGTICYEVLGYSETCAQTQNRFLTQTTRIYLVAPGGIPFDVLREYELFIRFPILSTNRFKYSINKSKNE